MQRYSGLLLGLGAAVSAFSIHSAADALKSSAADALSTDKLACHRDVAAPRTPTVLLSCGSFNPPTVMHLRMFDLATAALAQRGHDVWGCYMSPVADAYGKEGLAPVQQRVVMCQLAAAETPNVMVSSWEAEQPGYTRTLQVLSHVSESLQAYMQQPHDSSSSSTETQQHTVHAAGLKAASAPRSASCGIPGAPNDDSRGVGNHSSSSSSSSSSSRGSTIAQRVVSDTQGAAAQAGQQSVPHVLLLCGADVLATIAQPGVWKDPDIILRDFGVVCICREGTDMQKLLGQPGSLLHQYRNNIIVVEDPVPNFVSSTRVRNLLAEGQPVRYLVPDAVISYIKQQGLYMERQPLQREKRDARACDSGC